MGSLQIGREPSERNPDQDSRCHAEEDTAHAHLHLRHDFWNAVKRYIPTAKNKMYNQGRPAAEPRKILDGILYVLGTRCQWEMLPRECYSGSTMHRF